MEHLGLSVNLARREARQGAIWRERRLNGPIFTMNVVMMIAIIFGEKVGEKSALAAEW